MYSFLGKKQECEWCGYPLECYDFCYNRELKKVFFPQGDLGYPQGVTTVLEVYYIIPGIDVHLFVMFC